MSKKLQQAVLAELRRNGRPMSIRELFSVVRSSDPELESVPDFDLRSAILAMHAIGAIESDAANHISLRPVPA